MASPKFVYGTGLLTKSWSDQNLADLKDALKEAGIDRIDTAALYPFTSPGDAEKLLGRDGRFQGFTIDTKILYFGDGSGTLTGEAIQKSITSSLKSLEVDYVDILYCHGPDKKTPVAEQAAAFDAQYRKGLFKHLGVCNFSVSMLEEWLSIAEDKGYVKPSVFQGQYNLLCRAYEKELFPLLEKHGIKFFAFSPLAGGFLTGKLTLSTATEDLKGTRFEEGNMAGMVGRKWYDKPSMHQAIRKLAEACKKYDVSTADASTRWLLEHSALKGDRGDAVIIGPSNLRQLQRYADAQKQGKLPVDLVKELDALWNSIEADAQDIIVY